jgi:hypothetical protein
MADETNKPKLVYPELPKTDDKATAPAPENFDAAAYFKEAVKLRKPLQPAIRKVTVTAEVRVMRPDGDTWFQCNPESEASMDAYVIRDEEKRYFYIAEPMETDPIIYPRRKPVLLIEAAVWPPTVPYIIPFFYPDPDRKIGAYTSAWVALEQARTGVWTQMRWGDGSYDVAKAENNPHPPTFSGKPMWELLSIGFKDHIITSAEHPFVKQLRGIAD